MNQWLKGAIGAAAIAAGYLLLQSSPAGASELEPGTTSLAQVSSIGDYADRAIASGTVSGDPGQTLATAGPAATSGDSGDSRAESDVDGGNTGDADSTATNETEARSGDVSSGPTGDAYADGTATSGSTGSSGSSGETGDAIVFAPCISINCQQDIDARSGDSGDTGDTSSGDASVSSEARSGDSTNHGDSGAVDTDSDARAGDARSGDSNTGVDTRSGDTGNTGDAELQAAKS
jgi:hypothetical protein